MGYALLESDPFVKDLNSLSPSFQDAAVKKLRFLESNPRHPSLRTEAVESMSGILRSWVNDLFRLYWFYHPQQRGEIVLWRIGPRTWTDRLKHFPLPDLSQLKAFQRDAPAQARERKHKGFFSEVYPNHLILLGVPEEHVEDVKNLQDIEDIFELGLPDYAEQVLIDLYTSGCWGTERLVSSDLIFYRANANELESYCKGKTTRLLLNLHPEQRKYAYMKTRGPLLVKGVAGSGKTTIGLYRALYLVEQQTLFADSPTILFVTYNETLATAVHQLFRELRGREIQDRITVTTLRDWAMDFLDIDRSQIAKKKQQASCLAEGISRARKELPHVESMHKRGNDFFAAEIADVIKGRGVSTFSEYKDLDRFGREKGLRRKDERPFAWLVYETYQEEMRRLGLYDYEDLTILALNELSSLGEGALYDAVIVDEAQDLRPMEIELVARLAGGPRSALLTLLADLQQSIYYKGISWKEAGVEVVGRTRSLSKNFRNTREILEAARSLAEHGTDSSNDIVSPEAVSRRGRKPKILIASDVGSELQAVQNIILDLCQGWEYNPGDFAVLAHRKEDVSRIRRYLSATKIPVVHYREEAFDIREYQVKAITMHSAKGLEWPVVVVACLEEGKLPRELPPDLDEEERVSEVVQQRKLLYVAMTRAMERLYLVASPPVSSFLDEIDRGSVVWKTWSQETED